MIYFKVVEYDDIHDENYFGDKLFTSYEDGWSAIYEKFPVIYHSDGTQDDQEDILDSFAVVPCDEDGCTLDKESYTVEIDTNGCTKYKTT